MNSPTLRQFSLYAAAECRAATATAQAHRLPASRAAYAQAGAEKGTAMRVRISLRRRSEYAAIVEMTQERFDELTAAMDKGWPASKTAEAEINALIGEDDWQDDQLDYIDEFEQAEDQP